MSTSATAAVEKIAIIGGGMGGLSAAYFLSDPLLGGRYEVTVYSMGWRLGGKGASGRNARISDRIEEHGLHIWFGTYHNAIALMRRCYGELGRSGTEPLATFDAAFAAQRRVVLLEQVADERRPWTVEFPDLPDLGGERTVLDLLRRLIGWVLDTLRPIDGLGRQRVADFTDSAAGPEAAAIRLLTGGLVGDHTGRHLLEFLAGQLPLIGVGIASTALCDIVSGGLRLLARMLWDVLSGRVPDDDLARRTWILAYLGITVGRGIIDDALFKRGFDVVESIELRSWLSSHSSFSDGEDDRPDRVAFFSANLQAFYDASFSYVSGDAEQPNVAASVGLRCILRILFDYSGPIILEMQAGMGDTVFAPMYLVLKRRGVRFKFFHRLTELGVTADGSTIDRISLSQQVQLVAGADYQPLVTVGGLACWPSTPLFDQITHGTALQSSGANLEHWSSGWNDSGPSIELRHGSDYSWVVLAVSYDLLPQVAAALRVQPRWNAMINGLNTAPTQAAQLWFSAPRAGLGLAGAPEIFGGFVEPWSSLVDFSHLLQRESWPADAAPQYLNYTCGPLATTDEPGDEAVFQRLRDYLVRHGGELWPRAVGPNGFDWNLLHAPPGTVGEDRLRHQDRRANNDPTERYVIAMSGTGSVRLQSGDTGVANLAIAGEWTDTGVNISSIEATVISGMRAARAISGSPERILGDHDL